MIACTQGQAPQPTLVRPSSDKLTVDAQTHGSLQFGRRSEEEGVRACGRSRLQPAPDDPLKATHHDRALTVGCQGEWDKGGGKRRPRRAYNWSPCQPGLLDLHGHAYGPRRAHPAAYTAVVMYIKLLLRAARPCKGATMHNGATPGRWQPPPLFQLGSGAPLQGPPSLTSASSKGEIEALPAACFTAAFLGIMCAAYLASRVYCREHIVAVITFLPAGQHCMVLSRAGKRPPLPNQAQPPAGVTRDRTPRTPA